MNYSKIKFFIGCQLFISFFRAFQYILFYYQFYKISLQNAHLSIVQFKDNYSILAINMNRFHQLPFTTSKPKWQWTKIKGNLLTNFDGKHHLISLNPNVIYEDLNQDGKMTRLQIIMSIDVEKSLPFDNLVGWSWHKSSNLPPITIKIQLQDPVSKKLYPLPDNLQVRIHAVKLQSSQQSHEKQTVLQDVGLKGVSKIQIKQQFAIFDGLRFQTTSYINQGVNFHLIILLHSKNTEQRHDILSCVMSPPIFVDSRKSARDYFQKRYISYADAFHPSLMQRQFLKKSTKDKNQNQIKIQNSFEGLFNYLTAPNIRHKVKHPLLLCVKFSNVFKIFVRKQCSESKQSGSTLQKIITKLQKTLLTQIGRERKTKKIFSLASKPFLVTIVDRCTNIKKQKIYQCLEFLNCNSIQFIKQGQYISNNYENILQIGDVISTYKEIFNTLKDMSMMEIHTRHVSDNEEDNEQNESVMQEPEQNLKKQISLAEENQSKKRTFSQDRRTQLNTINYQAQLELNFNINQHNIQQKDLRKSINHPNYRNLMPDMSSYDQGLSQLIQNVALQNMLLQNMIIQNHLVREHYLSNLLNNLNSNIIQNQFSNYIQSTVKREPCTSSCSMPIFTGETDKKI